MDLKKAEAMLAEAELNFSQLSGMVKSQAAGVLVPVIGLLKVLLVDAQRRDAQRRAALEHMDGVGHGLREKTALGVYFTMTGEKQNAGKTETCRKCACAHG